jgi:D-alanyl-D-alanine carboxypeptidase
VIAAPAAAQDRYGAIVMDARTGEVLHEDQADETRYPASLTKMMTLYMLFEAIERGTVSMDTRLTASRNASRQPPSRLGMRRNDSITVNQAIRALVVQSANDVATMVAERLGGSEARFAANMTARARELGMRDTRFANASGLPDSRHRTTARDMALLSQALWRDFPEHYHVFQTPTFAWRRGSGRNHNRLLGQIEGVDGIKTGYTRVSGYNLASSAVRDGRRIIAVVLGGESAAARDAQVAYLIEGAFEELARRRTLEAGVTFANLPTTSVTAQFNGQGQVTAVSSAQSAVGAPLGPATGPLRGPFDNSAPPPVQQGDAGESEGDAELGPLH